MWFRRKRRPGGGTARGRSAPGLPDANAGPAGLSGDGRRERRGSGPVRVTPRKPADAPDAEAANISNAVASDEHLEWDFNVDLASDDATRGSGNAGSPKIAGAAPRAPGREGRGMPQVVTLHRRGESERRPPPGAVAQGVGDDIPVLDDVVDLPDRSRGARGGAGGDEPLSPFVERCLEDVDNRLQSNGLSPITPEQKRQLRTMLTSLLVQKTSGKFEV